MADHYVRHLLQGGDWVRTKFECRAPEDGRCRSTCKGCGNFAHSCDCRPWHEPDIQTGQPCGILPFLEDCPEECYGGPEDEPVRGPDWQPIQIDWLPNDDLGYEWSYEQSDPGETVAEAYTRGEANATSRILDQRAQNPAAEWIR